MPRRKYGRLRKTVEMPSKEKCSRCRSGKYCPIEGHRGQEIKPHREWTGPPTVKKRPKKTK
ncbi:MAG: hypothetical protein QF364_03030 [Candidatus Poseidoniaceae archaeon]|nr:hypothetical protein [Candidatus Poseidoniaceae archaeon]